MKPLHLTLEGFLSYSRQQTLSLEDLHVACLSGENGAGKSSIIDAITWAVWGEARKPSSLRKPDAALLNNDSLLCRVELRFESSGEEYTVIRTYRESESGKTSTPGLEFFSPEHDLTETSIRKTQKSINEAVGLSYETYAQTSFFLQGRADDLASAAPSERREVLSDVLSLGRFSKMRENAHERYKSERAKKESADGTISAVEDEAALTSDLASDLSEAEADLEEKEEALQAAREEVQEARELKEKARESEERLATARTEEKRAKKQLEEATERMESLEKQIQSKEELIEGQEEIEKNAERLAEVRERLSSLRETRTEHSELKESFARAERKLERTESDYDRRLATKRAEYSALPHPSERERFEKQLDSIEIRDVESIREKIRVLRDRAGGLDRALTQRRSQYGRAQSDIEKLEGGTCPVCEQETSGSEKLARLREEKNRLDREGQKASKLKERTESALSQAEDELERARSVNRDLEQKQAKLQEQIDEAAQAAELNEEGQNLAAEKKKEIAPLQKEVDTLSDELEEHSFDSELLDELESEESELSGADVELERVRSAQNALDELEESFSGAEEKRSETQSNLSDAEAETREAEESLVEAPDTAEVESRVDTLASEKEALSARVNRLETKLESAESAKEKFEDATTRRSEAEEKMRTASALKEAFSSSGIPALMIEGALPSLEETASSLLGRLTGGELSIELSTTRELSTGGETDTLDIHVIGPGGSRPFETFSGGESFRISFALRLALAQLAAGIASADMSALFIDEGFGTQDPGGLKALQDAIREVSSDFELILVVTHLDELKGAFEQRVDVSKSLSSGSTLTVQ